jgi:hypothetical protein
MNTKQSFLNGFVKRASEYGYAAKEADEMLKQAMRGQNAYSLINNVSKPTARRALTQGLSDASSYMQPAIPARGSAEANVLAGLLRKARSGLKAPPSDYMDKGLLRDINHTASSMMHPNTHPVYSNDLSKSTAIGKNLLGLGKGQYPEQLYPSEFNQLPGAHSADSHTAYLKRYRPELF